MKIASVAARAPARTVANDEVLDLVVHHSKPGFEGDLDKAVKAIDKLFGKTGIEARRWLAPGQHPMAMLEEAFDSALQQAGLRRGDIGLLLYASVGRGFIEPANSAFVANALGLKCRNFDVVDACMGWVTALEIVNGKMKAGEIEHAVVVNVEHQSFEGGPVFPKNFALGSAAELEYKFPSLTLGDAVTVTILCKDEPGNFKFRLSSYPELSDLCTISLPGWQNYCPRTPVQRIAPHGGEYRLVCHGGALHELGSSMALALLRQCKLRPGDVDHVFTHTSSPRQIDALADLAGIGMKLHRVGHRSGNVISASVPLALADAVESGRLKRGDPCLAWVGSSGMVFCAVTFSY